MGKCYHLFDVFRICLNEFRVLSSFPGKIIPGCMLEQFWFKCFVLMG
jgi:hypothetical protein